MSNNQPDIIVVGAGHNSLVAAAYLGLEQRLVGTLQGRPQERRILFSGGDAHADRTRDKRVFVLHFEGTDLAAQTLGEQFSSGRSGLGQQDRKLFVADPRDEIRHARSVEERVRRSFTLGTVAPPAVPLVYGRIDAGTR